MKSLHCAANSLRGTFSQCITAAKNALFCVYCMSWCACQLHAK